MIGSRPLDFPILRLLMDVPLRYSEANLSFFRDDVSDALKEMYDHHKNRSTREFAELVIYATWMAVSRSLNLAERHYIIIEVSAYISLDHITELNPDSLSHARDICHYLCNRHYRKRKRDNTF